MIPPASTTTWLFVVFVEDHRSWPHKPVSITTVLVFAHFIKLKMVSDIQTTWGVIYWQFISKISLTNGLTSDLICTVKNGFQLVDVGWLHILYDALYSVKRRSCVCLFETFSAPQWPGFAAHHTHTKSVEISAHQCAIKNSPAHAHHPSKLPKNCNFSTTLLALLRSQLPDHLLCQDGDILCDLFREWCGGEEL